MKEKNLMPCYLKSSISIIMIVLGILLIKSPIFGLTDPIFYFSLFFMGLGFANLAFHFFSNEKNNEILMFSLNNFLIGIILYILKSSESYMFIGFSISIFTFLDFLIRGYIVSRKTTDEYLEWSVRVIEMLGLIFLGCLVSNNIFHEESVITLILGFYFTVYGIITLLAQVVIILDKIFEFDKRQMKKITEKENKNENENKKKEETKIEISTKEQNKTKTDLEKTKPEIKKEILKSETVVVETSKKDNPTSKEIKPSAKKSNTAKTANKPQPKKSTTQQSKTTSNSKTKATKTKSNNNKQTAKQTIVKKTAKKSNTEKTANKPQAKKITTPQSKTTSNTKTKSTNKQTTVKKTAKKPNTEKK